MSNNKAILAGWIAALLAGTILISLPSLAQDEQYTDKLFGRTYLLKPKLTEICIKFAPAADSASITGIANQLQLSPKTADPGQTHFGVFSLPSAVSIENVEHQLQQNPLVRGAVHNGSSWGSYPAGAVYGNNGNEASASVANPPSLPERAVYTSTGSAPYALTMGPTLQKESAQEMIAYSRQLVFAGEDSSVLALRLFAPQIAGEHDILWDGKNDHGTPASSGAYFVELLSGRERKVAKMLLEIVPSKAVSAVFGCGAAAFTGNVPNVAKL